MHKRLNKLEANFIAAQRGTVAGLTLLVEGGMLQLEQLTDAELTRIVDAPVPGYEWIDWATLTNEQLEQIAAGADPRQVIRGKS